LIDSDFQQLIRDMTRCRNCGLRATCGQVMPGEGNTHADIIFLGEAPGEDNGDEDKPSQHLRRTMASAGLRAENYFISTTTKCKPPDNRAPTPGEAEACWPWTLKLLQIIRPRIIVTMGKPALITISQKFGFFNKVGQNPITKIAGIPYYDEKRSVYIYPMVHPSYACRSSASRELFSGHMTYLAAAIGGWLSRPIPGENRENIQ
jgi:DNA polymerase